MIRLTMLMLIVLSSLNSFSQTYDSLTCVPNSKLRKAEKLIIAGKRDSVLLVHALTEIVYLNKINAIDSILIAEHIEKDEFNDDFILNLNEQIKNLTEQTKLSEKAALRLNRKLKVNKILTKASIVVAAVGVGILLTK